MARNLILIFTGTLSMIVFSSLAFAQVQSHPLSQLYPHDVNLNLTGVNITNVSYVFFGNNSVDTYLYRSGTNTLQTASHLVVTGGWVNSTNFNASGQICLGGICNTAWPSFSNNITGAGTAGYIPQWVNATALNNSNIYQLGSSVGINTTSPTSLVNIISGGLQGALNITNGAGTSVFYVNASSGNVGINTTSPGALLHIQGSGSFGSGLRMDRGVTPKWELVPRLFGGAYETFNFGYASGGSTFSNIMALDGTNAKVGIGTDAPTAKLTVGDGTTAGNQGVRIDVPSASEAAFELFKGGDIRWKVYSPASSNNLRFYSYYDIDTVTFQSDGKVGIGTTTPATTLDVGGGYFTVNSTSGRIGIGTTSPSASLHITDTLSGGLQPLLVLSTSNNPSRYVAKFQSDEGNKEVLWVGSDGNVGIGTTSPGSLLHVSGTGSLLNVSNGTTNSILFVNGTSGNVGIGTITIASSIKLNISGGGLAVGNLASCDTIDTTANGTFICGTDTGITSNNMTGYGTAGYIPQWANATALNNSNIYQLGSNVGIGTTSPTYDFDIRASAAEISVNSTGSNDAQIRIGSGSAQDSYLIFSQGNTAKWTLVNDLACTDCLSIYNYTGSNNALTIAASNSVGIGTTAPGSYKLNVIGDVNASWGNFTDVSIADNGGIIIGHTRQYNFLGFPPEFQVLGTGVNTDSKIGVGLWSADADGPSIILAKSRNAAIGSWTIVQDGDTLGRLVFSPDDGTGGFTYASARIAGEVDGTPGSADVPGRLVFSTTADGASTVTERVRITSAGNVGINTTSPSKKLHVIDNTTDWAALIQAKGTNGATAGGGVFIGSRANNAGTIQGNDGGSGTGHLLLNTEGGNVTIGGVTNVKKLDVVGDINATGKVFASGEQVGPNGWTDDGTTVRLSTATDSVGIGTASPVSELDVRGDGGTITLNTAARGVFSSTMTAANGVFLFGAAGAGTDIVPLLVTSENTAAQNIGGGIGFAGKYNTASNQVVTWAGILGAKEAAADGDTGGYLAFGTREEGNYIRERMRITSLGNVGIGTTSPVALLDVGDYANDATKVGIRGAKTYNVGIPLGQLNVQDSTSMAAGVGGAIAFSGSYTGTSPTTFGSIEGVKSNGTDGNYAGELRFFTRINGGNNTQKMVIDTSGNVGIGKTPQWGIFEAKAGTNQQFVVRGPVGLATGVSISALSDAGSDVAMEYRGNPHVFSQGNVGIGATVPAVKLDVAGSVLVRGSGSVIANAGAGELQLGYAFGGGGTAGSVTRLAIQPYAHTGGPWNFISRDDASNAWLDIKYGSTAGITLRHDGNVGIGTASPGTTLDVSGIIRGTDLTCTDCLNAGDIAASAIGTSEIADGTVSTDDIATDTIAAGDIAADAVGDSELFNGGAWTLTSDLNFDSNTLVVDQLNNRVGIGTASPIGEFHVASVSTTNAERGIASAQYSTSVHGALLTLRKARGTAASPTTVANADYVGGINFEAYGTAYTTRANIWGLVSGTVSADSVPTDLTFETGATSATEKMRITSGGNVGINTTTPQALLQVATVSSSSTDAVNITNLGTGDSFVVEDSAGDTTPFLIDNAGNVGIGTASPGTTLDVSGIIRGTDLTCTDCLNAGDIAASAIGTSEIADGTVSTDDIATDTIAAGDIAADAVGDSELFNGGAWTLTSDLNFDSNTLVVDQLNNRVGIGTASPSAILHVKGTSPVPIIENAVAAQAAQIQFLRTGSNSFYVGPNGGGAVDLWSFLNEPIRIATNNIEAIHIDTAGNVGIGTTASSPTGKNLEIGGTTIRSFLTLSQSDDTYKARVASDSDQFAGSLYLWSNQYYQGGWILDNTGRAGAGISLESWNANSYITFATRDSNAAGLERMRIDNAGKVGIGTSIPNEGLVEVKGGSVCVDTNSDNTASSCIASESDERLKTNVVNITGALDKIGKLRGVSFDWRVNDSEVLSHYPLITRFAEKPKSVGLIAQEVAPILPEAIMQETVGDNTTQYLQLDYDRFIPLLVEGIKEQQEQIEELKVENAQLKTSLDNLESRIVALENAASLK